MDDSHPTVSAAGGLTAAAAREALTTHGPNEIRREVAKSRWVLFGAQFVNPLVGLLLAACVVSALFGEIANAIAIGVIVVINAVIGYFQEARAERALLALRAMTAPRARAQGRASVHHSGVRGLPGDALLLEAGDVVAADAIQSPIDETGRRPVVAGTDIKVGQIAWECEYQGMSPDDIVEAHPHMAKSHCHQKKSCHFNVV